jgi:ribonuclease HII
MAVLVGIDEAGFGPILGPLVVSSTTFSLPDSLLNKNLWQVLQKSVARKRKHLAGKLLITDSKKAFSKAVGIKHLEKTVLTCLRCLNRRPETLRQFLEIICPEIIERLKSYPWYGSLDGFRRVIEDAELDISSKVFMDDLAVNNINLTALKSCCLDVAFYNKMVSVVKNKSSVLFTATSRLIKDALDSFGDNQLNIIIDRQGGRVRYRKALLCMFEGMELTIIKETPKISSYQLTDGKREMKLHFVVGADDKFLPVALASMVSKYLRELLILNINRYFCSFYTGLRPTAGYYKDGRRFIRDLSRFIPNVKYDSAQLIRSR